MKKLLYLLPVFTVLAAACSSTQPVEQNQPSAKNQPTQTTPPPVAGTQQTNLEVVYPSGGETLDINSTVVIRYQISNGFKSELGSDIVTEMYLVDKSNVVVGYIGQVNTSTQTLNWKPSTLGHWAGLDITNKAPKAGEYKILLVSRKKTPPLTEPVDSPVDIYTDQYTKVQNDTIVNTISGTVKLQTLSFNLSNSFFLK